MSKYSMRAVLLAFSFIPFSLSVLAEPSYYTWVDAQGVVHNTLVEDKKKKSENDATENGGKRREQKNEVKTEKISSTESKSEKKGFQTEGYQTEEEYKKNAKEREDKPFYTWTDADGTIRNNEKPDVFVEFSSTEAVYDAVFAPPFRLPIEISGGLCCANYKDAFKKVLVENASLVQKITSSSVPYKTQTNSVPAGYFTLFDLERSIVFIKAFKLSEEDTFEVIALNEKFQPLYLSGNLKGLYIEQTWKDLAYNKVMLEISDSEVRHLIIFSTNDQIDFEKGYSLSVLQGPASD